MTIKKARALNALLTERTQREAAAAAGISITCLQAYMHDPEFSAAYRDAVSGMLDATKDAAAKAISPAIDTLRVICESDTENAQTRVSAARSLLEYAIKLSGFDFSEGMTNSDKRRVEILENRNGLNGDAEDSDAYFESAGMNDERGLT